jgi:hypothetical protein
VGYASHGHVPATAKAAAGWSSAVLFRACLAEQSAVALDADLRLA